MKRGSYWNLRLNPNHGDSSFMMAVSTQFEHQTSLLSVQNSWQLPTQIW